MATLKLSRINNTAWRGGEGGGVSFVQRSRGSRVSKQPSDLERCKFLFAFHFSLKFLSSKNIT